MGARLLPRLSQYNVGLRAQLLNLRAYSSKLLQNSRPDYPSAQGPPLQGPRCIHLGVGAKGIHDLVDLRRCKAWRLAGDSSQERSHCLHRIRKGCWLCDSWSAPFMMEDVSSAEYTHKSSFAHEDRNIQGLKPSRNGTFGQVLDKGIRQVEQFGITSELSCPIPGKRMKA